MKSREHEVRRLDVAAFAADAATLSGQWPVQSLQRLQDVVPPDAPRSEAQVDWEAAGELRRPLAVEPQVWMRVRAQTTVWMQCQRCLQPMAVALHVERAFRFVRGEDEAARLDAESDDDVLELTPSLDLRELLEDELLLALPLVPRHEQCPQPLVADVAQPLESPAPNPFAVLATLKDRVSKS